MNDLPHLQKQIEEHEAWKEMCRRLQIVLVEVACGQTEVDEGTLAGQKPLLNQIKYWGETLHRLRLADPQYDDKAYAEAKEAAT